MIFSIYTTILYIMMTLNLFLLSTSFLPQQTFKGLFSII